MTQTAAAFAPAVGQIGGGLLSRAFGGGDRPSFQFPDVRAGGLSLGETGEGQIVLGVSQGRRDLVSNLAGQFRTFGQQIGGLRERVGPGFQNVLESRLRGIESGRQRAIGTISENLSRRRVLGSSFGQAAIAQAEREFAEAEANARAQTFLEGIDVEQQLITAENAALIDSFQTELNEQNLQFQAATIPLGGAIQAQTQNSLLQQQLAAQAASGFGAFGAQVGGIIGGLLNPGTPATQALPQAPLSGTGINPNEPNPFGLFRTDPFGRIVGGV